MLRKTITIKLGGETDEDLDDAFQEVSRLLKDGFRSGFDANDFSRFSFEVENTEDESEKPTRENSPATCS